ncbi:MAG: VWA domain-containing protein, partial [Blastocatellia bacterium]
AQQQTQDPPFETLKLKTNLVVVDALVADKKTRELIRNLRLQDFELHEDGQHQELEYLSQDKLPLSLLLLLDVSPSVIPVMEEIRNGALQALQRLKPEDEVALMVFSGHAELIQDFTKDRQLILIKLSEALEKTGGGTRIHDAVGQAARQFKHAILQNSRRVVLVITDNQGSMSRKYDDVSEASVRDAVIESRATFCGVIARSMLNALNGIMMQHPSIQEVTKKTSVNPYVELTGGEMTAATKETVNTRLGEMIDRLRNCYSVGYSPTNQDFNGKFRRVQLTLTPEAKKRLGVETVINARQGYYAVTRDNEDILAIAKPATPAPATDAPANKPAEVATKTPDA